jgi:hypothetical protein
MGKVNRSAVSLILCGTPRAEGMPGDAMECRLMALGFVLSDLFIDGH